jgi:arylsulfatase
MPTERNGRELAAPAGASFERALGDEAVPSTHREHYVEQQGHRGYYRGGWEVVTLHQPLTPFSDAEWELYDLTTDPNELHDVSVEHPERRAELAAAWEEAAWANRVYPLDEGSGIKYLVRPIRSSAYADPVTILPGTATLERWRSLQLVWFRAVSICIRLEHRPGDNGYLVAHGDQGAGYGVYVLDHELVFVHNDGRGRMRELAGGPLDAGAHEIVLDLAAPGNQQWIATLLVDGDARASLDDVPMLYGMAPFEGIDVGIDRRSPVSWELYERFGPFPYTGTIRDVRYEPGEPAPDAPERVLDVIREMGAKFE